MKSLRFLDRRAGYSLASLGLLLGMVVPATFPAFASAAQLSSRSIALSNSAADASGVGYALTATLTTPVAAAGGMIIEFCDDTPLIGLACHHPAGLTVAGVSADSGTATDFDNTGDHATIKWIAGGSGLTAAAHTITFSGIHNPTAVGTFYARVLTYAAAPDYTSATVIGTVADQGEVALATTDSVGVTAYVLETMTFCVSNDNPGPDCSGTNNPSVELGEQIGTTDQYALTSSLVSTATDYAQISTNAIGGAVVNLHSSTTGCGGLVRAYGSTNCDITAQNASSGGSAPRIANGEPKFGIKLGTVADAPTATGTTGTIQAAATSHYDSSNYFIDYVSGDATGVTSTYGSKFLDTNNGPVNNKNMPFTLGASISNSTPAGIYGATLNLVATGTF